MSDMFTAMEIGCNFMFLDSGSFTLWTRAADYAAENKTGKWAFYDTPKFWEYIDAYANFIKKYRRGIDLYANVDVIPNPELSLRNQNYLEQKHSLNPVPVVHFTTDLKWLSRYISAGYKTVALGGLVGSTTQESCKDWIDRAFQIVCDTPDNMPRVNIHGFGITSWKLLLRYPWWSVDSSSWTKVGAYGGVLVPHLRKGKFVFTEPPYLMKFSNATSASKKEKGKHFDTLSAAEKAVLLNWLNHIGVPLGKCDSEGDILEYGVINRHSERKAANLYFFEAMRRALPAYPWAFVSKRTKGFGLTK